MITITLIKIIIQCSNTKSKKLDLGGETGTGIIGCGDATGGAGD